MTLTTRYQITVLLFLLAINGLLLVNRLVPMGKPRVMVLATFEVEDETGREWHVIEYLVNGHVEQVNCNSAEQAIKVREYLGIK